jgi:hypothetical protein
MENNGTPYSSGVHKFSNGFGVNVLKLNSVAFARKRTIPTERPPLVGEVSYYIVLLHRLCTNVLFYCVYVLLYCVIIV